MDTVHIERMKTRFRLRPSQRDAGDRLNHVLAITLGEYLESALERAGVSPHEEICVREVSTRVRLALDKGDDTLATAWSLALAEAIRDAATGKGVENERGRVVFPDLVRYTSRIHALVDVAVSVARGDTSRAWAWKQLGLWSLPERVTMDEAVHETVRALIRNPDAIVPVLWTLSRQGRLAGFAVWMGAPAWVALAVAAVNVSGVSVFVEQLLAAAAPRIPEAEATSDAGHEARACRIARSAWLISDAAPFIDRQAIVALAALAVLEVEPSVFRRSREDARVVVTRVAREIEHRQGNVSTRGPAVQEATSGSDELASRRDTRPAELLPEEEAIVEAEPVAVRESARTEFGGLLFLTGLVEELGLVDRLADKIPDRPFRWTLHLLAKELTASSSDDPACLAFAGLLPNDAAPDETESAPAEAELAEIAAAIGLIGDALEERLRHLELDDRELLRFVYRRPAEVIADPGWIELHFSLDDVSVDLRVEALDLDPGYVPWLGVVIKFVYE